MKLKHAVTMIAGGTPDVTDPTMWAEEPDGVPWVSISDMSSGNPVTRTERRLSALGLKDRRLRPAAAGTVLFAMYASVGAVAVLEVEAVWNQAILGLVPRQGLADGRFVSYWLQHLRRDLSALTRTNTQANLNAEQVGNLPFSTITVERQRQVADFLDDQVARIDEIIRLREEQVHAVEDRFDSAVFSTVRGQHHGDPRKSSGLDWLRDIPDSWLIAPVSSQYSVMLGKMLNEERARGHHLRPYLRNTNVQWDRVDTDDLAEMDFPPSERSRYEVRPGDLLICEGGQPGRAAVWHGNIEEIYYQKALHRARPRGQSCVRWLFYLLRVAVHMNVFAAQGNQATISHLTGEQLSAQRFPFPPPDEQKHLIAGLDMEADALAQIQATMRSQIDLLQERRRSLITAAVTGEFDVTTASGRGVA